MQSAREQDEKDVLGEKYMHGTKFENLFDFFNLGIVIKEKKRE